jgi:hypothetical protein
MAKKSPEGELPDDNDCYGQLTAPSGLAVVAELFARPGWSTRRRVSGYSGAEELILEGPGIELETDPQDRHRHFIGGRVEPSERGRASLRHVSDTLGEAGIVHRLELYVTDTNTVLETHQYGWSDSEAW